MSHVASALSERAAELRSAFDRAFAEPLRPATAARVDLLGIRAGAQVFAVRLSEIAGLFADKKITRVPGGGAALCGLAGFRGATLPVYDLQHLLGQPGAERPRWLVIAAAAPIAFAFDAFVGQLRVDAGEIVPQPSRPDAAAHASELVRTGNFIGPILNLASLLEAVRASGREQAQHDKE